MKETLCIGALQAESGTKTNGYYTVPKTLHRIPVTIINGAKDGKIILITSGIHGGEYPNIISDQVKLVGNIRACYREDFEQLKKALEQAFHKVEEVTGAQVCLSFPKDPVLPFANDPTLTAIAADTGRTIFGSHFLLEGEDELFLTGDNAYRYYKQTK